jgi:hypothetical protein
LHEADQLGLEPGFALVARRHERLSRKLKNVSMNRPEKTNQNHQYNIRRVFIRPVLTTDWQSTGALPAHQ